MAELNEQFQKAWEGFAAGEWQTSVNTRDFIQKNYTPYEGDESFLAGATEATTKLWDKVMEGIKIENRTHAPVDFDTDLPSTITAHDAGYIDQGLEQIVGLQTDKPLKRAIIANGGIKMVETSCKVYGRELDPMVKKIFSEYRKTHNQGVFDVYTKDILNCRKSGVITGLPDAYGRGRIIGDYRRVALYGIDFLMADKLAQFKSLQADLENGVNLEATIRLREEISEQHRALAQMKVMAAKYGCDISVPAKNAKEAVQWTYFAYLAAVKSQNGAAMSFGRTSSFLDIYIERDLQKGLITEQEAMQLALARARSEIDQSAEEARLAAARREALEALLAEVRAKAALDHAGHANRAKKEARHKAGLLLYCCRASDQFWTFSSVRRLRSLLQPGRVCAVGSSGRLSP